MAAGLWLLTVVLLLSAFYYLWPLRIFIRYLRKNSNAKFKVYLLIGSRRIRLGMAPGGGGGAALNQDLFRKLAGEGKKYRRQLYFNRFLLRVELGFENPAITGMAIGGGWALEGRFLPLLLKYFHFRTRPLVTIIPDFHHRGLRVLWEGELVAPLWLWIRLWSLLKISRRS